MLESLWNSQRLLVSVIVILMAVSCNAGPPQLREDEEQSNASQDSTSTVAPIAPSDTKTSDNLQASDSPTNEQQPSPDIPSPEPTEGFSTVWEHRAPLLEANSETAVAQLDDKFYILGGYPFTRTTVVTVQVYDSRSDSWEFAASLPLPINHGMAAAVKGKVYIIGGQTSASGDSSYLDTVYEYDPTTDEWTARAQMPTKRSAGATAVIGDKIYVAGGRPPRGNDFAVYDAVADSWTTLPDLATQRNHLAAAAIDGKVYVVGGRFGGGWRSEMTDALEAYDPESNTWSTLDPMPTVRGGVNGIAANGCLYVFGGEGLNDRPNGVYEENEVYDPTTDTWQQLEPIPVPVHGVTGSAFIDGWIHLPGGGTHSGGSSGDTIHQVFRAEKSCG